MIRHIRLDKHAPRHSAAVTYELDPPYRSAVVTIVRMFRSFGLMFGLWEAHPDPYNDELVDAHLFNALNADKHLFIVPPLQAPEFSDELFDEEALQKDAVMYMLPLGRRTLDAYMEASVKGPHSPEYLEELRKIYERQVADETQT
jgi:hypothetical protein